MYVCISCSLYASEINWYNDFGLKGILNLKFHTIYVIPTWIMFI